MIGVDWLIQITRTEFKIILAVIGEPNMAARENKKCQIVEYFPDIREKIGGFRIIKI